MAPQEKGRELSSQFSKENEVESQKDKLIRKSKEQPFIPIGKWYCSVKTLKITSASGLLCKTFQIH